MLLPSVVVVNIISYTWREVHVLDLYTMSLYKVIVIIGQQGGKYHGFDGGKKDKNLPGRVSAPRLGGLDIFEILLRKLLRLDDLVTPTGKHFVSGIYRHFMGRTERRRLSLFKKSFLLSPVGCSSKCKVHFCDPPT